MMMFRSLRKWAEDEVVEVVEGVVGAVILRSLDRKLRRLPMRRRGRRMRGSRERIIEVEEGGHIEGGFILILGMDERVI